MAFALTPKALALWIFLIRFLRVSTLLLDTFTDLFLPPPEAVPSNFELLSAVNFLVFARRAVALAMKTLEAEVTDFLTDTSKSKPFLSSMSWAARAVAPATMKAGSSPGPVAPMVMSST